MRGKNKMIWECPVCHKRIDRRDVLIMALHIEEHPDNQDAFRGKRYELFRRNRK